MLRFGPILAVTLGTGGSVLTLSPLPIPGLMQPLAEPLSPALLLLAWCGVVFCGLVGAFGVVAMVRPDRALGALIMTSAIGASFCLGPVVALLMSGVVLSGMPLLLGAPPPARRPTRRDLRAAQHRPLRPRRLFA